MQFSSLLVKVVLIIMQKDNYYFLVNAFSKYNRKKYILIIVHCSYQLFIFTKT